MYDYRQLRELWEWQNLAPYASHSSDPSLSWRRSEKDSQPRPLESHFPKLSAGDAHTLDPAGSMSRFKTAFQLDKERIGASTAFRRLEYKTQIFISHEGDHFRTRLTHTLEVNETARFIAQALRLNEDLVEAIALGHDLGHTPFGHTGEETLHRLFRKHWPESDDGAEKRDASVEGPAFYHNVQSVRVVDSLEKGYEWDRRPVGGTNNLQDPPTTRGRGLDLTWAVREGILKHSSRGLRANDKRMYGSSYLLSDLKSSEPATLEGQVVEFADEIASVMHDLEDGLRSRLVTLDELREGLSQRINTGNLPELLGLTPDLQTQQDTRVRSRLDKFQQLLALMENGEDCTMGNVLAFLRTVLISNLVETSRRRIHMSLCGGSDQSTSSIPPVTDRVDPGTLIWLDIRLDPERAATSNSYCPEAWEIDPTERKIRVQTFRRQGQNEVEPTSGLQDETVRLWWSTHGDEPNQHREIIVERQSGRVEAYPLGSVCITFTGAKLVGYDASVQGLRTWLRREFIRERLHHASVVFRMNDKGRRFLTGVFELYFHEPNLMHRSALARFDLWDKAIHAPDALRKERAFVLRIAEHLQGMTDRYLTAEYERLFLPGASPAERDEMSLVDGGKPPFGPG